MGKGTTVSEGTRNAADEAVIDAYITHLTAQNLSKNTTDIRRRYCRRWAAAWPLLTPTTGQLVDYIAGAGAPASKAAMRAAMKSFYTWAHDEGLTTSNPAARIGRVRVPRAVPRPMPDDLIRDALARAPERVRLMLMLGALAGLRRAEIAQVHSDHVTPEGLRVFGKGGVTRLVPLVPELRRALEGVQGWAFPSPHAGKGHMNARYVGQILSQYLPAGYTCHQLRHRFATTIYQQTHDIRAVQELLGHSSIMTTQRYTAVGAEHLHAAVMRGRFAWTDA